MYFGDFHPYYNNSYAVIVGVNKYQNAGPLTYATKDAEDFASVLVSQVGFSTKNIITLLDNEATKDGIMNSYLELVDKASSPDDRVIFFFAGHGLTVDGY